MFYDNHHLYFSPANQQITSLVPELQKIISTIIISNVAQLIAEYLADNEDFDCAEFTNLDLRMMASVFASFNSAIRNKKNKMSMIRIIHWVLVNGGIEDLSPYHINCSTLNVPALISIVFVHIKNPVVASFGKVILSLYGLNFVINIYKYFRYQHGHVCNSVRVGQEQRYFDQVIKPAALLDQKRNRPVNCSIRYKNRTCRYIYSFWLTCIIAMISGSVCIYLGSSNHSSDRVSAIGWGSFLCILTCCACFSYNNIDDKGMEVYSRNTDSISSFGNQSAFFPVEIKGQGFADTDIVITTQTSGLSRDT
jgi:hypothetical protein